MKKRMLMWGAGLTALALITTGCGNGGSSDEYPSEDITLVVPYPAGSAPDANARVIAQQVENDLGVSVIVENVEGGSSTIGLNQVANSEPDGYTLVWGTRGGTTVQNRLIDNPFGGMSTLTPVARVNLVPNVLTASPDRGWDSIDDFIAEAKANPSEVSVGIGNAGSSQDIGIRILEREAGIELKKVYFDAGQMVVPAVNGTVDLAVSQFGPVAQYVEKGDLEYIGVFTAQVPAGIKAQTLADAGYDTTSEEDWEGIFGPADLPQRVVEVLSASIQNATESTEFTEFIKTSHGLEGFLPAAEFADEAKRADENAPRLIEELGLGSDE